MTRPTVRAVEPPPGSAIAGWYSNADLLDSFAVSLPADTPLDIRPLACALLAQQPAVVRMLMSIRDAIMAKAGVATSADLRRTGEGGDRIGFFPVVSSTPSELVIGYDDRHLDFRTSIAVAHCEDGGLLLTTTAVRCHNLLGRLYLLAIRPFHVKIVRAGLRRAARAQNVSSAKCACEFADHELISGLGRSAHDGECLFREGIVQLACIRLGSIEDRPPGA